MPYRVRDENGHEYTQAAEAHDGQTAVDKPALDRNGRWRPAKYQNPVLQPKDAKATPATPEAQEAKK